MPKNIKANYVLIACVNDLPVYVKEFDTTADVQSEGLDRAERKVGSYLKAIDVVK